MTDIFDTFIAPKLRSLDLDPENFSRTPEFNKKLVQQGVSIEALAWDRILSGDGLHYDEVEGKPSKSNDSRFSADISTRLTKEITIPTPFVSANMECVTDGNFAFEMAQHGGVGVIHQFHVDHKNPEKGYIKQAEQVAFVKNHTVLAPTKIEHYEFAQTLDEHGQYRVGAAVGVNDSLQRAPYLIEAGIDFLVLDIAHGYSDKMLERIKSLSDQVPVIAGNIISAEAALEYVNAGVHGVKVGIAPGDACITSIVTGYGSSASQLSADAEVNSVAERFDIPIMNDGGVKSSAHVVQAWGAGASTSMMGRIFAATPQSSLFNDPRRQTANPFTRKYWGSSSDEVNELLGYDQVSVAEGEIKEIKVGMDITTVMLELSIGAGSAASYAGSMSVAEFKERNTFRYRS